ncbi:hypothetical protein KAU33_02960 [Candidatus Dependentiae bacterium]|nr:hypothetical protein [Candidatus Dependentiae bacterium]
MSLKLKKTRKTKYIDIVFISIAFLIIVLTSLSYLSCFGWVLELTSHFKAQYLFLLLTLSIYFILRRKWLTLTLSFAFLILNLISIIPLYIDPSIPEIKNGTNLTLLLINVQSKNLKYYKVINFINKTNPDIIVTLEINLHWKPALAKEMERYEFQKIVFGKDDFGIGLYSKYPLINPEIFYFGPANVPTIISDIDVKGKIITLCATHPKSPGTLTNFRNRNIQLSELAKSREKYKNSFILIGDLNLTSWSCHFNKICQEMKLYDSRKGFGIQATWPAKFPLLLIPIDHCLLSEDIKVLERKIGGFVGSDHRPIILNLLISNDNKNINENAAK